MLKNSGLVRSKGGFVMVRFILILFVFVLLLGLSPMLNASINASQTALGCDSEYGFLCFIMDAALPVLVLVLLGMLIGFLRRE